MDLPALTFLHACSNFITTVFSLVAVRKSLSNSIIQSTTASLSCFKSSHLSKNAPHPPFLPSYRMYIVICTCNRRIPDYECGSKHRLQVATAVTCLGSLIEKLLPLPHCDIKVVGAPYTLKITKHFFTSNNLAPYGTNL